MKRKQVQADVSGWPAFDAPLLQGVVSAFLRRRKAIRYRAEMLSCEREFSETGCGAWERLNFDLCPGYGQLRLSVWDDGTMWLRLCVAGFGRNSGWIFKEEFHGSINDVSPEALLGMIEHTIAEPFLPGYAEYSDPIEYRRRLWTIWGRVRPFKE
jgi:hypothetical protein